MTRPVRLQLSRKRGFNLQAHSLAANGLPAVNVARPTVWGNRWKIGVHSNTLGRTVKTVEEAVYLYEKLAWPEAFHLAWLRENLAGKNLACWCRLCPKHAATGKPFDEPCPDCAPCHADVLGARANGFVCEALG